MTATVQEHGAFHGSPPRCYWCGTYKRWIDAGQADPCVIRHAVDDATARVAAVDDAAVISARLDELRKEREAAWNSADKPPLPDESG